MVFWIVVVERRRDRKEDVMLWPQSEVSNICNGIVFVVSVVGFVSSKEVMLVPRQALGGRKAIVR